MSKKKLERDALLARRSDTGSALAILGLVVALGGCGASLDSNDVDPAEDGEEAASAIGGTMLYFGGPAIANPKVYVVWWGPASMIASSLTSAHGGIADFFTGVTNSSFVDGLNQYDTNLNAQYGSHSGQAGTQQLIGRGNFAAATSLLNVPSGNVTDAQIRSALTSAVSTGILPAPDANSVYVLYFPPAITITASDGSRSCTWYDAYHDVVRGSSAPNLYYIVVPDCGTPFSVFTTVSSAFLADVMTNPNPATGSNPDYPQAWTDSAGSEIGSLCESSAGPISTPTGSYSVQGLWDERSQRCKITSTAAQDFSLLLSPNVASLAIGASRTLAVQTTTTVGAAEALTFSVAAPAGVTASVSPTQITSGQTATLTVTAQSPVANAQVVVRAAGAAGTHTASLLLNPGAPPPPPPPPPPSPIVNGGFESGTTTGWAIAGTTSIASSGCHGGSYCAQAGVAAPTNGDSSWSQTFTAGAGQTTLTFWYLVSCPDLVIYDWATATLRDNTVGTTTLVLAKTCVDPGAWTKVTAAVTGGHSYTLTLVSHDDDYSGDGTFTRFDDVSVQ